MASRASYTNGSAQPGSVVRLRLSTSDDPLFAVERLGARAGKAIAAALAAALLLHAGAAARAALIPYELIALSQLVRARIYSSLVGQIDVEVEREEPAPPEPEPEPEPLKETAPPEPVVAPPPAAAKAAPEPAAEREPPPPAAAQAGAVMTADPDPDEPVDLTNTFVSGPGTTFAGGVTQTGGTSTTAVRNPNARAWGTPTGTGRPDAPPPPPGPDRSRAAGLDGSANWSCPWPAEADAAQIDEAVVTVRVSVRADGSASKVDVLSDPGYGFGREARNCALRRRNYKVALDPYGTPIAGETKPFNIRFDRD